MLRLTEEELKALEARRAKWERDGLVVNVRTHRLADMHGNRTPDLPKGTPRPPAKPLAKRRGPGRPRATPKPPEPARPREMSEIEGMLFQQLEILARSGGLAKAVREFKHVPGRDFRLDFAWPDLKFGVEVQGMVHRIKGRFKKDIEKRALGLIHGWRILEVGGAEIRSGQALAWIEFFLRQRQA